MRALFFLCLFSSIFAQEAKLSLFLFNDIEKSHSSPKFLQEIEKTDHCLKVYQGEFSTKPKDDLSKLSQMKVDVALFSKELLCEDISSLQKAPVHLLTSNLMNQTGNLIDQSLTFSLEGIKIGLFGLAQYALKPPENFSFFSVDLFFAAKQKVKEMKKKGVDFIILVCSLDKEEVLSLVRKVDGIDVILANDKINALPFFENQTLIYFQEKMHLSRLDLLIEKKQTAQGSKIEFYPTWKQIE
jgi:hypothetical protein